MGEHLRNRVQGHLESGRNQKQIYSYPGEDQKKCVRRKFVQTSAWILDLLEPRPLFRLIVQVAFVWCGDLDGWTLKCQWGTLNLNGGRVPQIDNLSTAFPILYCLLVFVYILH